ncbi:GFA family protein [Mesorhizobium sp.]|uniref:GFA family protein n=1 Tax=Mesorhizobium sp. TaxID=1871066 RepID=UPI000FE90F5F|nr:GFA family protein [Mesorhizobium sp.]RWI14314.1 MAG: GFA family protein [Mesorhizobium sp.]RWK46939.1 MAG: GFA family protein [Mesorhizobium sp.]RWK94581.1 MAG: GFA family protein [Mesorhizobium sp.]TIP54766.1 MAG: GFA family protein [Mesorhizobium sp.]TIP90641.1 MAG: GFA family protein [Mesorhizobium sp.]
MPLLLKGSCRCNAIRFEVESHTPVPFMLCYCSICRKQQGGGGFAINLGADFETLRIKGKRSLGVYQAEIEDDEHPQCEISSGERNFCKKCGSALWLYDRTWPELVHPFASAIDTDLPKPPEKVHLMLKYKANWVEPEIGKDDKTFDLYPEESIADWHKRTGMWVK